MHHRLAPKPHRFNHAFYFYAFDLAHLDDTDNAVFGFGHNRLRPISIHDKDYVDPSPQPILNKLKRWLNDHNYTSDFDYVKLVTSPRHFNYVFNPVSFYLCYDAEDQLKTVVAEVNNTFKERHLYVVDALKRSGDAWTPSVTTRKSFHVSPFNSIDGDYAFQVIDNEIELRITIDLIKNGEAVFCSELVGQPTPLTSKSAWKTIARYPFRPAMTFPRILWEAGKLYVNKRLAVKTKPVPRSPATINIAKPSFFQSLAMRMVLNFFSGIQSGRLEVVLPSGEKRLFGNAHEPENKTAGMMHIRDYRFFTKILFRGSIGLGESYVDEFWQSDDPTSALLPMARSLQNLEQTDGPASLFSRIIDAVKHRFRNNSIRNSRNNIEEHYDLGNDFYETFLDPTLTYSAGVFDNATDSLEQAQLNKIDALIRKADIRPEHHVLEIGSGWGSFAIRAAQTTGCRVTTITLSKEQHQLATLRIRKAGLEDQIDVRICDYRDIEGQYDRIVSIEMLEAVGHEYLGGYFTRCHELLKPDGRLVLQVITIPDERYANYCRSCDWIQKYIFPGGHLPSVGAINNIISKTSTFRIQEMENIGLHYARTLREWRTRFMRNLDRVRELGYSDSFIRKWEYYLSYCEAGFEADIIHTQHIVLAPLAENS